MKKLLEKFGIHKMDEMERSIALKAQRNALIYVGFALTIWSFYESYKVYTQHTEINLAPSFLLISTSLVLIFSQFYLRRRAVKGDEEYEKSNSILKVIVAAVLIMGIIALVAAVLIIFR